MKTKRYFRIWYHTVKEYTFIFLVIVLCGIALLIICLLDPEIIVNRWLPIFLSSFFILIIMIDYVYILFNFCNLFYSIKISDSFIYSTRRHYFVEKFEVGYAHYRMSYKEAEKLKVSIKDIQKIEFIFEPIDYKGRELLGNYKFELLYGFNKMSRSHRTLSKDFFGMFVEIPRPFLKITDIDGKNYLFSICYFKSSQVKDMLENLILRMKQVNNLNYMNVDTENFIEEYKKSEEFYKKMEGTKKL